MKYTYLNFSITCVTLAVSDFQDVDIVLNITYTGTPDRLRPTPVLGRAVFGSSFLYRVSNEILHTLELQVGSGRHQS